MKIKLSPLQTYVYPVMNTKEIKIVEQISYGGEKSVSVPCGFVSQLVYEKKMTKRQRKNQRYHANKSKASNSVSLGDRYLKE